EITICVYGELYFFMQNDSTCEEKTFQKLFMNNLNGLRNFLYYKSGDTSFAEDAAQEAFVRLWKNCAKVPIEKAKNFLFTAANNLFLDEAKHRKVKLKFQQHALQNQTSESPEFLMEEQEFKKQLEEAINALPAGQREVFLMNRIDKMKYREIAEALGISQKAVEKRMHKALMELRKLTPKI
ncbi:MAG: sigma-70 family RNA polymerase sigma factor, partial [Bacteroidota bacterium]